MRGKAGCRTEEKGAEEGRFRKSRLWKEGLGKGMLSGKGGERSLELTGRSAWEKENEGSWRSGEGKGPQLG